MRTCDNCGATLPNDQGGRDQRGAWICCPHCMFNPLGCRCQYGEYGVEETREWYANDEDSEEEVDLEADFREAWHDAMTGNTRPFDEVLAEVRRELADDDDHDGKLLQDPNREDEE